jgi:uncharacterized protein (TIGR03066 family)
MGPVAAACGTPPIPGPPVRRNQEMPVRALRPLLAVCLLFLIAGLVSAQGKPQELIVGTWQPTDPNTKDSVTVEFLKDGKVKVVFLKMQFDGSYKFLSDTEMEFTLTVDGKVNTNKLKIKVDEKTLEMTPPDGKLEKYTRVKDK